MARNFKGPEPRHPRNLERRLMFTLSPRISFLRELFGLGIPEEEIRRRYLSRFPPSRGQREVRSIIQQTIDHTRRETARTAAFGADIDDLLESAVVSAGRIEAETIRSLDGLLDRFLADADFPPPPIIKARILKAADLTAGRGIDPGDPTLRKLALEADLSDEDFRRRLRAQEAVGNTLPEKERAVTAAKLSGVPSDVTKAEDSLQAAEDRLLRREAQVAQSQEVRQLRRNELLAAAHEDEVRRAVAEVEEAKNSPEMVAARKQAAADRAAARAKKKNEEMAREAVTQTRAKVTKDLQEITGIRKYEWVSKGDSRVRPLHRRLNGKVFDWSDPPPDPEGYPGEPYGCRCVARPVKVPGDTVLKGRQSIRGRFEGEPTFIRRRNPTLSDLDQ